MAKRTARLIFALLWCGAAAAQAGATGQAPIGGVVGDGLPGALTDTPGDPARGRAIVANRQLGLCLLCHTGPIAEERFQGNLAPDLAGAGQRWSTAQLRLRVVDARRLNPQTIMPAYYRVDGLRRVPAAQVGVPLLAAQQVEDVVAYLAGLRQ